MESDIKLYAVWYFTGGLYENGQIKVSWSQLISNSKLSLNGTNNSNISSASIYNNIRDNKKIF